jgi:hypothetical protein
MYYEEKALPLMEITREFWYSVLPKVNLVDFLVTWNLRHLIKPSTQAMVRRVNINLGLPVPLIVTPEDFFEEV